MEEGRCKPEIPIGIAAMLTHAKEPIPEGEKYFFRGDLCQRAEAVDKAWKLGIKVNFAGGLPYVSSREEFNKVAEYIVKNRVEGHWHYKEFYN